MFLWKSKNWSHKLDVQKANVCVSQFYRFRIFLLDAVLRLDGLPALDVWDVVIEVLHSSNNIQSSTQGASGNSLHMLNSKLTKKGNQNVDQLIVRSWSRGHKRQFFSMWSTVVHFWKQRGSHQDDHQRKKSDDVTRIKNPQSRVTLVVW